MRILAPVKVGFEPDRAHLNLLKLLVLGASSAESEIADLDLAVFVDKDISGFEVSVDDVC